MSVRNAPEGICEVIVENGEAGVGRGWRWLDVCQTTISFCPGRGSVTHALLHVRCNAVFRLWTFLIPLNDRGQGLYRVLEIWESRGKIRRAFPRLGKSWEKKEGLSRARESVQKLGRAFLRLEKSWKIGKAFSGLGKVLKQQQKQGGPFQGFRSLGEIGRAFPELGEAFTTKDKKVGRAFPRLKKSGQIGPFQG